MLQGHRSQSQRCCHVIGSRKVSTITDESGFPGDFRAQSLDDALGAIRSKQANKLLVCSFNEMKKSAGNVTIRSNQALSIAGRSDAGQDGPRLWVRFEVNGTLFGEGVTVRDQSISPSNATDPLQGAALLVLSNGHLVAKGVSFVKTFGQHELGWCSSSSVCSERRRNQEGEYISGLL